MNYYLVHRGQPITVIIDYGTNSAKALMAAARFEERGDDCKLFNAGTWTAIPIDWRKGAHIVAPDGTFSRYA